MILSKQNMFSDNEQVSRSGVSENYIDLSLARDIGPGTPIPLLIQLTNDAEEALTVTLEVDDDSAFPSAKAVTKASFAADAVAGTKLSLNKIPSWVDERYARLRYTKAGAEIILNVVAGITMGNQYNG